MKIYFLWTIILQRKTISIFCLVAPDIPESGYLKSLCIRHTMFFYLDCKRAFFFFPSVVLFRLVVKFPLLWYQIHNLAMWSELNDVTISVIQQIRGFSYRVVEG